MKIFDRVNTGRKPFSSLIINGGVLVSFRNLYARISFFKPPSLNRIIFAELFLLQRKRATTYFPLFRSWFGSTPAIHLMKPEHLEVSP